MGTVSWEEILCLAIRMELAKIFSSDGDKFSEFIFNFELNNGDQRIRMRLEGLE